MSLLRSTTSDGDDIYAEQCDRTSPASIRVFCSNYLKRLDAVKFAYKLAPIGNTFSYKSPDLEKQRQIALCSIFLLFTVLSPLLLAAPVERDTRIIVVVIPAPDGGLACSPQAIFMQRPQCVLDARPSGSQVSQTDVNLESIPVVSKVQRSNIVVMPRCRA